MVDGNHGEVMAMIHGLTGHLAMGWCAQAALPGAPGHVHQLQLAPSTRGRALHVKELAQSWAAGSHGAMKLLWLMMVNDGSSGFILVYG